MRTTTMSRWHGYHAVAGGDAEPSLRVRQSGQLYTGLMAYELEAILGSRATIGAVSADLEHAAVVTLGHGLAMIPLTDRVLEGLGSPEPPAAILRWARAASRHGLLAYCSAAYFGGIGEQEATVFQDGVELERGVSVNRALQLLGIVCDPGEDEWDTVGLGRCRHTDRWT